MKKVYISLPISGLDIDEQKMHARIVTEHLRHFYSEIVNPFDNGIPEDAHASEHMRADFRMLLDCDAIFMCRGWEDSQGCMAEFEVARCCHMDIVYETNKSEYYR